MVLIHETMDLFCLKDGIETTPSHLEFDVCSLSNRCINSLSLSLIFSLLVGGESLTLKLGDKSTISVLRIP
jgi:hypothetical protein